MEPGMHAETVSASKAQRTEDDRLAQSPSTTQGARLHPWRVYWMNDCDWWIARSLDEAQSSYFHETGVDETEDVYELADEDMERLKIVENAELPHERRVCRTFKEELALRVSSGLSEPELFASTEY
jgi:hypothetical protein